LVDKLFKSTKLNYFFIKKEILLESQKYNSLVREIVKHIVYIFKNNSEGEFYLPYDVNNNEEYEFKDIYLSLELILEKSKETEEFLTNAEFYPQENVVSIKIVYNPANKSNLIYNLIGELNEVITHEITHLHQRDNELFYSNNIMNGDEGFNYYTKPEEIDAQYYGFKRMSKITKKPFEDLVRNWFKKYKDIHQMNNEDSDKVINMILNYKPKT